MCKSCYYAEWYQKLHRATGADFHPVILFLVFNTLTNDKYFHSSEIQNSSGNMEGKIESFEYGDNKVSGRFKCRRNAGFGHKGI